MTGEADLKWDVSEILTYLWHTILTWNKRGKQNPGQSSNLNSVVHTGKHAVVISFPLHLPREIVAVGEYTLN